MKEFMPFRVRAKLFLKGVLPKNLFKLVQSLWISTFSNIVKGNDVVRKYENIFLENFPPIVQAGPFAGMRYVDASIGSSYLHKLIGSYEAVLHPVINDLEDSEFDTVIDIGTAEGYYLVGFGKMFPKARLVGFEIEEEGRRLSKELFAKNSLNNELLFLKEATGENVGEFLTQKTLLICDCEGGEVDILDPEKFPRFSEVDFAIIELHDFIRPGAREILTERFKNTHTVKIIRFKLADPEKFPFFAMVNNEKDLYELRRERACQEQEWMILEKK